MVKKSICILGAGAFGTALAVSIARPSIHVDVLARSLSEFSALEAYPNLPKCSFILFSEFEKDFSKYELIILAIPCQSLRSVCLWMQEKVKKHTDSRSNLKIISAAKGIETNSILLPHQILESFWHEQAIIGALSGPSFSKEMIEGQPTCVVVASKNKTLCKNAAQLLHAPYFRIYDSDDIVGVELGGALKNIIAMVAGAVDGLELGYNARAAVITRGLAEIAKIGVQLGAKPMTFMGLSGLGDLILTCTGHLSRNRQFGLRLARGEKKELIIDSMGGVIEGYSTTESAYALIHKLEIKSSIIDAAYQVLYKDLPIKTALKSLINSEQRSEFEWNI